MKKKIIRIAIIYVLLIAVVLVIVLKNGGEKVEVCKQRTDIEILQKWFPNLEGIESAVWEAEVLGADSNGVPGPGTYEARGFIYLIDEKAEEYLNGYEWEEKKPQLSGSAIDISAYQEMKWYYSRDFEKEVKPDYYVGNMFLSGDVVWFEVCK